VLEEYLKDEEDVVRESCQVALNQIDFWTPSSSSDENNNET